MTLFTQNASAKHAWQDWTRLLSFVLPYRGWLAVAILAACSQAGLNIGFAFLTRHLTDSALAMQMESFLSLLYLAVGLILVGMLATYGRRYATAFYQLHMVRDLRNRVTQHIQKSPLAHLETVHSGDIVTRLNDDVKQIEGFVNRIPDHVYQPVLFSGAVIYMWMISWKLLFAIVVLIPISALVFNRVSKPLEENNRTLQEKLAATNAFVQDVLGGLAIVKAFNLQPLFSEKYGGIATELQDKGTTIDRISAYLTIIWLALRFIPQLVVPLFGGYLMIQGELTVGSFLAAASLMWYVFQPVEALLDLLRQIRETTPAIQRVLSFLAQPTEEDLASESTSLQNVHEVDNNRASSNEAASTGTSRNRMGVNGHLADESAISFNQVSFAYHDGPPVLAQLNFALAPEETVALVGPSGAGKSTIIELLCGFYQAQDGQLSVFGQDTRQMYPTELREQLSLVAQESYLFPTTIAENIGYGRLDANRTDIIEAAKAANAHDFISSFPQGYETSVGERGNLLSGGQRQRIALARAILKDAPILLLDEPTAALDTQSEKLVEEALDRFMGNRTVLVIAHRLSTIQRAHRILVLNEGRIVEDGSHQSLLAQEGLYHKLYVKQVAV
ncbi:MAG: ABC transporter ATP-binding protein [Chloroflexota bacterium]